MSSGLGQRGRWIHRTAASELMKHYIELTKPRITWLILMSTA